MIAVNQSQSTRRRYYLLPPILGEGGRSDKAAIDLATKRREWIRNVQPLERAPASLKAAERKMHALAPGIRTRSLSATYNCFGMVFAGRRTYVLNDEQI